MRLSVLVEKSLIIGMMSVFLLLAGCGNKNTKRMEVTATAYTSDASQTHKDHPTTTAWGDELKPGLKCIAVSRDLIPLGLTHKTKVKIEGLPGTYVVLDKMNKRWEKKIDIYMGNDKEAAIQWGKRKVTITWKVEAE
jgi:3D (Asp-Asp-Asp) domain-containing protein